MSPYDHFVGEQPSTRTIDQAITDYSIDAETLIDYDQSLRSSLSDLVTLNVIDQSHADPIELQAFESELRRRVVEDATLFALGVQNFSVYDNDTHSDRSVPPSFGDVYLLAGAVDATDDANLLHNLGHILINTPPAHSELLRSAYLSSLISGEAILTEHRKLDLFEDDRIERLDMERGNREAAEQARKEAERLERWNATMARAALRNADANR